MKTVITEDGYRFTEQPDGTFTDGDMTFNSYAELSMAVTAAVIEGATDFCLHCFSDRGSEFVPLDNIGSRFDLCDAMYLVAERGDEHYKNVCEAIEPILSKQAELVQAVVDGISYTFTLGSE